MERSYITIEEIYGEDIIRLVSNCCVVKYFPDVKNVLAEDWCEFKV